MPNPLDTLSPLDGRYLEKTKKLRPYFSEAALIRHRVWVEVEWLIHLCNEAQLAGTRILNTKEIDWLRALYKKFSPDSAKAVKRLEKITNHDVKAVEYFIKDKIKKHSTKGLSEFVHFACTSEDINNLAYGLMQKGALIKVILPALDELEAALQRLIEQGRGVAMLSHTHGQPASPTTVGKEVLNVQIRLMAQADQLRTQPILGKINGAVGNWNAHVAAYPDVDWVGVSYGFIEKLGLEPLLFTTQIEPHDYLAELSHNLIRLHNILIDWNRDVWTYISKGYFTQKLKANEVGSSTMPHKVNPIDFENSEGNLGIANALLDHFANKLPLSRMQRDLTDSTVLRNLGSALGYGLLGYTSCLQGMRKLDINTKVLRVDLDAHWEVLGEALVAVMRRYKIQKSYEKIKELTRGKGLTKKQYQAFVKTLKIPKSERERLAKLTPHTYLGLAKDLTIDPS